MIGLALKLLRDELSDYLFRNRRQGDSITQNDVILHNIARPVRVARLAYFMTNSRKWLNFKHGWHIFRIHMQLRIL